jgi:hypothetical protein
MTTHDLGDIPPCLIYIDKEGRWYHDGIEMIHRDFVRLFYQHMEIDHRGRYIITWKGQQCYVEVEDTAFVIRRVAYQEGDNQGLARFILSLSDDTQETLLADTVFIGEGNVIYCSVKEGTFPARFSRAAYYQLAQYIEEDSGEYYLPLNGKRYEIRVRR